MIQFGIALKQFVENENIIKIGYGLYTKAKISLITEKITIQESLTYLAKEALTKLGVKYSPSRSIGLYNEGKSTQVPTDMIIAVTTIIARIEEVALLMPLFPSYVEKDWYIMQNLQNNRLKISIRKIRA